MKITQVISRITSFRRCYLHGQMHLRIAACAILIAVFSSPHLATATTVRMETSLGNIDIELYDDQAPKTVANFLRYTGRGDYNTTIIHRSKPGFIIQGGGYKLSGLPNHLMEDPPIQNEFSPSRSNVRGTIAMAKIGGDPNSATSEWFFNLADNSANLDYQNGGFTVFGRVTAGMNVVDDIASLQVLDHSIDGVPASQPFKALPVINYDQKQLQLNNLVLVTNIPNVAATRTLSGALAVFTADVDMTFSSARTIDQATMISRLAAFTQPANKTILFNSGGILTFTMTGALGQTGLIVTLLNGNGSPSTHYYGYGPTPGNAAAHWYDFSFDGETGAEFVNGKILLHFIDGKRGDDDLTVNSGVTHAGISALAIDSPTTQSSSQPGGCTITAMPSQTARNGDWIVISMFLAFVALVRRRARMH